MPYWGPVLVYHTKKTCIEEKVVCWGGHKGMRPLVFGLKVALFCGQDIALETT